MAGTVRARPQTHRSEVAKHAEHGEGEHLHRTQTEFEGLVVERT